MGISQRGSIKLMMKMRIQYHWQTIGDDSLLETNENHGNRSNSVGFGKLKMT